MIILIKAHTQPYMHVHNILSIHPIIFPTFTTIVRENLNPSHLVSLQKSREKTTPKNYKKCSYTINYSLIKSVYLEDGLITMPDLVTVCIVSVGHECSSWSFLMKPDHWYTDLQYLRLKIHPHHPHNSWVS